MIADLGDVAAAVKAAVVSWYSSQALSLPTVQGIVPATPVFDCEQLSVQIPMTQPHTGSVNSETVDPILQRVGLTMAAAHVSVWIARCIPTIDDNGLPPTSAASETAALAILADYANVQNAIFDAVRAGLIPGCAGTVFEGWDLVEASGGIGGSRCRFRLDLSGF